MLCTLCSNPSDNIICSQCLCDLPALDISCVRCSIPMFTHSSSELYPFSTTDHQPYNKRIDPHESINHLVCGQCISTHPPYSYTRCVWHYDYPVNYLIHQFKSAGNQKLGQFLSLQLLDKLQKAHHHAPWPDVLIPMPLHWQRWWHRGFNQSDIIANTLSKHLNIPCLPHALTRKKTRASQKKLNAKQRFSNLKDCFTTKTNFQHQHVALIDDVITTTATIHWASLSLLKAGAESVQVWGLARTPQPRLSGSSNVRLKP